MSNDEEQIRDLVKRWQKATSEGDIDTVLGLMADDVVFLLPGREPMYKAEFAELSKVPASKTPPKIESQSEIQEIQISVDIAFIWTKLAVAVIPPGNSQPIKRAGYTLTVFKRIDGKWLLARDANLLSPVQ